MLQNCRLAVGPTASFRRSDLPLLCHRCLIATSHLIPYRYAAAKPPRQGPHICQPRNLSIHPSVSALAQFLSSPVSFPLDDKSNKKKRKRRDLPRRDHAEILLLFNVAIIPCSCCGLQRAPGRKTHLFQTHRDTDPPVDHNADTACPDPYNFSVASAFQSQSPPWATSDFEEQREGTIFGFSSKAASDRGRSGTRFRLRKRTISIKKKGVAAEAERSNGAEQRRTAWRGVGVCLKRRKTGKNVAATKCGSSSSKDSTLFGWGLNVGIMYMMSAGKAEINKLSIAMDETARTVQELKSELHKKNKKKITAHMQLSRSAGEANTNQQTTSSMLTQPELNKSSTENRGPSHMKMSSFHIISAFYMWQQFY